MEAEIKISIVSWKWQHKASDLVEIKYLAKISIVHLRYVVPQET